MSNKQWCRETNIASCSSAGIWIPHSEERPTKQVDRSSNTYFCCSAGPSTTTNVTATGTSRPSNTLVPKRHGQT